MPIRLRLTLWQTGLLVLVLAGFALLVFNAVARQEAAQLDLQLRAKAGDVEAAYRKLAEGQAGKTPATDELAAAMTDALGDDALAATLLASDGTVLAQTANLPPGLSIADDLRKQVLNGYDDPKGVDVAGEPYRLIGDAFSLMGANGRAGADGGRDGSDGDSSNGANDDNRNMGVVFVVASEQPMAATLDGWRWLLAGVVAAAALAAWAIGWFVTSAALRPVDRLTRAARAIGEAGDASGRVPEPAQADELGRLARAFNWMLGRLDDAAATQRRFLADAAHELRTPLTVVQTNAQALLRQGGIDADPAARQAALQAIAREADRMARLTNDLLTLARVDAGQAVASRRLALDELALEVYHQERPLANGVRLEIGAWDRVEVLGDADRLKQVLLNLVDNALRYTPAGGTVTLEVARADGSAVVRVRDTGPGIPLAEQERVFERFYRLDAGRARADGGSGLGLAIAREVAEAHGGRIELASQPGAGSAFALVVPLADAPPHPASGAAAATSPPRSPQPAPLVASTPR